MHVPRRRRQTTQSTLDSLHGDAPLAAGRAHVRVRRRGHARDPRPWPARFINSRQGAGAGLAWRDVRALHCMHHAWLSRLARASCLHALQQAGHWGPGAGTCIAAARPASGRAARAAGPGLVRCICMAWTPGAAPALLAAAGGRAASGRAARVCLDRRLFISRQRNPKEFLRPCLFVRMNELA